MAFSAGVCGWLDSPLMHVGSLEVRSRCSFFLCDLLRMRGTFRTSLGQRMAASAEVVKLRRPWLLKVLLARRRLHNVPSEAIADIREGTITRSE